MKYRVIDLCHGRCHITGYSRVMSFEEAICHAATLRRRLPPFVSLLVRECSPELEAACRQIDELMKQHMVVLTTSTACLPISFCFPEISDPNRYHLN